MVNIVIPMAGLGSRFVRDGYEKPKPFIDVAGKPMIMRVLDNLWAPAANFILVARREHIEKEKVLVEHIKSEYGATFVEIESLTEGTACTVLYARSFINNDVPLVIANSDQIVDMEICDLINDANSRELDGSILTFFDKDKDPKWSFAALDEAELVVKVREKEAISHHATVGIYYFSRGADFVDSAIDMIVANDRVNNEFYTCPVYNYLIREQKKIGIFEISEEKMHGIGTPEDLNKYLSLTG
jgi:UDP-N-acetylglucosamine diphosphorylase / glucose-1-phosphate thymidylyltransferase / UDP-N-acetylgalactosamine diphosphorylase / glucosamine-1-phosphate N-acetyltransferase / galactosamine-1-phosphate N-acetyltransferase